MTTNNRCTRPERDNFKCTNLLQASVALFDEEHLLLLHPLHDIEGFHPAVQQSVQWVQRFSSRGYNGEVRKVRL